MAKAKKRVYVTQNSAETVKWHFPLKKDNLIVLGFGILTIVLGYLLMSRGLVSEYATPDGVWASPLVVDVAPVVLVIGYCVIIPYAIIAKKIPFLSGKDDESSK